MTLQARYVLGSLGALLLLFGAFVLLRARFRASEPGSRLDGPARRGAWTILILGGAGLVSALLG